METATDTDFQLSIEATLLAQIAVPFRPSLGDFLSLASLVRQQQKNKKKRPPLPYCTIVR